MLVHMPVKILVNVINLLFLSIFFYILAVCKDGPFIEKNAVHIHLQHNIKHRNSFSGISQLKLAKVKLK